MSRHEKSKSIFETLGIGSTKRKGSHKHNGSARPVSTNEPPVIDDLEIDIRVKRMTIEEVHRDFKKIIEDMNIPKDKQEPLFKKSLDEKRDFIKINMKKELGKISLFIIKLASNCL
jgi:hypothetical protein